ncbi:MAG TPA: alkaline phosphatase family protein [Steroidobacteraceae bacterium]|nr:alkaline phosphatase family protein [Steroidobacteraceae bacterium]
MSFARRVFTCSALILLSTVLEPIWAKDVSQQGPKSAQMHRVIIFVWDGLRPDLITVTTTPNLARLRDSGVNFQDNHSTYPTLTMINAASFATGSYPGKHGFFGNSFWAPKAVGKDSTNREVDFSAPIFTEDYSILRALDKAEEGKLLAVPTLFEVAHQAGMVTAIVGKGGPTYLQSKGVTDFFLDDRTVLPLAQAKSLSEAGYKLPAYWANAHQLQSVSAYPLASFSGSDVYPLMNDGLTSDPSKQDAITNAALNAYQASVFLNYVLPTVKPQLSMLWLKNPDSNEHAFGPGSAATLNALQSNDAILGLLLEKLGKLGWRDTTDLIVVSDHGHSHISGAFDVFPLRSIVNGEVGDISADGYSVSGEVRSADLLRRVGLMAFDGGGPQCNPIMSGIKQDGTSIYTGKPLSLYSACRNGSVTTGDFRIPDAKYLNMPYAVIAMDGGSEYYYVPSHDKSFVGKLVTFFQSHKQYGAVFVDATRYGKMPGTLPLSLLNLQNTARNSPDIIVSFTFEADASVGTTSGIEYCGCTSSYRGMHGSFSPRDVHNVLIASGPRFKSEFTNNMPSGNVDVAPTVAYLLGLPFDHADGRVLYESLTQSSGVTNKLKSEVLRPVAVKGLTVVNATDPDGHDIDKQLSHYSYELETKVVRQKQNGKEKEYRYFDQAKVIRN